MTVEIKEEQNSVKFSESLVEEKVKLKGYGKYFRFVVLGLFLVSAIIFLQRYSFYDILRHLKHLDFRWAGLTVLLNFPILLLMSERFRYVLRRTDEYFPPFFMFGLTAFGNFMANVTPGGSGTFLRSIILKEQGVRNSKNMATIFYEQSTDVFFLGILSLLIIFYILYPSVTYQLIFLYILSLFIFPIILGNVHRLLYMAKDISLKIPLLGNWVELRIDAIHLRLNIFRETLVSLAKDWKLYFVNQLFILMAYFVLALRMQFLFASAGVKFGLIQSWLFYSIPYIVGKLSGLPLGLVAMDASLLLIIMQSQILAEKGIALVLLMRLLITIPMVLTGFVSYLWMHKEEIKIIKPTKDLHS